MQLKSHECAAARDALAKYLYNKIFDLIVLKINKSIPFQISSVNNQLNSNISNTKYIGVLDIAGFGII